MKQYEDRKIAVITGGTKGIGKALTLEYLKHGCFVISIYGRDDEAANLLMNEIRKEYWNMIELIKADLSQITEAEQVCIYIYEKYKKINYIILNAAVTNRNKFGEISIEDWNYVMNVNLNIPFFMLQKLNGCIQRGGSVLLVGAVMGIYPHAISIPYAVSKAGLHMLAKQLVKHLSSKKVTVNVIAPGFVETTWQKDKPLEQRMRIENKIALKRFAKPEEIAQFSWEVMQNKYLNGSLLTIDGGYCYE